MGNELQILGLTDVDRVELEQLFHKDGQDGALAFEQPTATAGASGILDPLTATVAISAMTLAVIALWICRRNEDNVRIRSGRGGKEYDVSVTHSSTCQSDVVKQLAKLFSIPIT